MKVSIIGSGNVAVALAEAISKSEHEMVQIIARNKLRGEVIAFTCDCEYSPIESVYKPADIFIVALSDSAIGSVTRKADFGDAIVVHTAGSLPQDAMKGKIRHRGVLYPLQTFTSGITVDFKEIPILVEASDELSLTAIESLAKSLSDRVLKIDPDKRATVHLAAVFVCNFTNHLYVVAEQLLNQKGLPFELMKPLIGQTTRNVLASDGSPKDLQTGPAVRGDFITKGRHTEMLKENNPIFNNIYTYLSNDIWETSKKK